MKSKHNYEHHNLHVLWNQASTISHSGRRQVVSLWTIGSMDLETLDTAVARDGTNNKNGNLHPQNGDFQTCSPPSPASTWLPEKERQT